MVVVRSVATSDVTDDGNGGREEWRDGRRSRNEKEVVGVSGEWLDLTT